MYTLKLVVGAAIASLLTLVPVQSTQAAPGPNQTAQLSSYWGYNVSRWGEEINLAAGRYGIDPDLIAAVILVESGGQSGVISSMGAVGLMGIMPSGPGFEFRPNAQQLLNPYTNINWGAAIFADIVQQSGGDIIAALAAYNGGWEYASRSVPRNYATQTLDHYARAVAVRSGISANLAPQWTIALEIGRGNIPVEPLVLGQPVINPQMIGQHVVYDHIDASGRSYYVKAYAVPIWPGAGPKPGAVGVGN